MPDKLTKRVIDLVRASPGRDQFLWCGEVRGFGIRIKPSGAATFVIQYKTARKQTRRMALGPYGTLTVDQARALAKTQLVRVLDGNDPSQERKDARAVTTVAEMCDIYLADAAAQKVLFKGKPKKASTLYVETSRINRHIKPLLGRRPIDEITRKDVERMMDDITDGKTKTDVKTKRRGRAIVGGGLSTAVKAVKLLSALYGYAVRKRMVETNPCIGIEKPADNRKTRFLSADEYKRLGVALSQIERQSPHKSVVQAIRALALTGCRKTEILALQPAEIDKAGRCLRLRDTKTGRQMRPCGAVALNLLHALADSKKDWVFPALRGTGHLADLPKTLAAVCKLACIDNVTAHTLRHSFATVAHELNYSELTIAGLLGHSAGTVTARYAHHVDHALASAADQVSAVIAERLGLAVKSPALDKIS
jgi:integrase